LHEQSAEALGESFAGVAAGAGGLSSMFWNPATITKSPGIQTSSSYSLIIPYSADQNTSAGLIGTLPSAGNTIGTALVPASYASYQINDQWWVGVGMNSPFGLATKNKPGTAPQLWGRTTSVFTTAITPELAFKVNDWISVGVGVQAEYLEVRESTATGILATSPVATVRGNSWGVGFTAGVTLTPVAGTELGIGYRSQVRQNLKGSVDAFVGALPFYSLVSAPITLPDTVSVGLRQRVSPDFNLLAGVEWTNWSKVKTLTVTTTNLGAGVPVPAGTVLQVQNLNFKDGWMFSLGGEYNYNPNLTLRAGVAYEIAPVDDSNRTVRLLDSDRIWASIGASYKVSSKMKLDLSYAHIFYKDGTVNIPAGSTFPAIPFTYTGNSSAHGDVISLGMSYRWDEPVAAVVAKY
jgi:long-chain fatty acid transport protein